jgi:hypothetical protein
MSILSAIKQQSNSINDLAKLPQTMIMQMAQRKEIVPEMVPVILAKKAEMIDRAAKAKAAGEGIPQQSVMDQIMAANAQSENPQAMGQVPPPMPQQNQMAQRPMMQQQQPPQGAADVGIATNPVPPMQMAGGGIIAFARGDLVEDDEDEQDEYDDYVSAMKVQDYSIPLTPAGEADTSNMPTQPAKTSQMPAGGIKQLISSKAEQYKVPSDLMQKIAYSESGGRADAANPLSSAKGLFQFTNATWKGMGGKEGEQLDPEKNAELGAKFIRQNAEGLKKAFGRDPTYGEVYAANHFGLEGAKELLSLDPKTPMEKAVSSTVLKQNPYLRGRTVGDVMSQLSKKTGQGTVELAEGGAIHFAGGGTPYERMLEKQKQENLASVEDFVKGSDFGNDLREQERIRNETINKYGPASSLFGLFKNQTDEERADAQKRMSEVQRLTSSKPKDTVKPVELKETADEQIARESSLDAGFTPKLPPAKPSGSKKPIIKMDPNYAEILDTEQSGNISIPAVSKEPLKPTGEAAKRNKYDDYFDRLMRQEEAIGKQEKNDQNMALLAAALKMYGGTSQYANANIGEGGLAGLQMMSDAQKTRAAQRAALDKSYGVGLRYQELGENTKAQLAQSAAYNIARIDAELRSQNLTKEARDELLVQRKLENDRLDLSRTDTLEERRLKNLNDDASKREQALDRYTKMLLAPIDAKYKNNPLFALGDKKILSQYEAEKAALFSSPEYIKRYNKTYPDDPYIMPEVSDKNTLKFDSKGNPVK